MVLILLFPIVQEIILSLTVKRFTVSVKQVLLLLHFCRLRVFPTEGVYNSNHYE